MTPIDLPGYAEAVRAVEANMSSRAKRLALLERFVEGTQYEGLPDWFSDTKPLWERAPCIVDPIVQNGIESNQDLLLGEGRFPLVMGEDVEGDEAEKIEAALARLVKQSRLRAGAREAFAAGQGCGTAAAIFGVRSGRLFIDTVHARWCEQVELNGDGSVKRLEIQYPYLTEVKESGQRSVKAKLFRRVIDETSDTTFIAADARTDGIQPTAWIEDPSKTIKHGLGFCPVIWYPHMRGCAIAGEIDGHAIHENLLDEIRAHDFALSQKHRAALYAGDPQWTEIGVEPGYNPTGAVRTAEVATTLQGGAVTPDNPVRGAYHSRPNRSKARKKSPGTVWQYPKDTKVQLHVLPGDALDALDKHARDLRIKLAQSMAVVFLDPETMPHATTISGRALEKLKARQLDRCDTYRDDFGDHFLLPAVGMLIRIAIVTNLRIEDLDALDRFIKAQNERWSWQSPTLALSWGRYIRLDADDETKIVDLAVKARDGGVATTRTAVEKLRGVFDIKDIDAYVNELVKEKREGVLAQQKIAAQMMRDTGDMMDEQSDDESDQPDDQSDDASPPKKADGKEQVVRAPDRRKRRGRSRAA